MGLLQLIKRFLNNSGDSPELISTEKKKKEELHVQLGSVESCLSAALATVKLYPLNKTKTNLYKWKNGDVRGYKVISFCDYQLDGSPAKCHIFKVVGKENNI